jgi:hypothetical protein
MAIFTSTSKKFTRHLLKAAYHRLVQALGDPVGGR